MSWRSNLLPQPVILAPGQPVHILILYHQSKWLGYWQSVNLCHWHDSATHIHTHTCFLCRQTVVATRLVSTQTRCWAGGIILFMQDGICGQVVSCSTQRQETREWNPAFSDESYQWQKKNNKKTNKQQQQNNQSIQRTANMAITNSKGEQQTWPRVHSICPRKSSSLTVSVLLSMSYTAILTFWTVSKWYSSGNARTKRGSSSFFMLSVRPS